MNQERKSLFPDEEPAPIPRRPQSVTAGNSKVNKRIQKTASLVLATVIWFLIKQHLKDTDTREISGMQSQAEEKGAPLIIDTTSSTITSKVNKVITGKEEPKNTVIINPPGQEPAIQVITPDATITANKTGEVETIIPKEDTKEKPLTETEARQTVDTALKDAIEKTLPKEEPTKPTTPLEEKK